MPASPVRTRTRSGGHSPISTVGRKGPRCRKCHQPRLGHPRTGCPNTNTTTTLVLPIDPSSDDDDDDEDEEDEGMEGIEDVHLNTALGSVCLGSHHISPTRSTKPYMDDYMIPDHETIASSNDTEAIVAQLKPPEEDPFQQRGMRVRSWVANISREESFTETEMCKSEEGYDMPCHLTLPSASFEGERPCSTPIGSSEDLAKALASSVRTKGKPLSRTMSVQERSSLFHNLENLSAAPPASLYTLPKSDVEAMQTTATKLGYTTLVIAHMKDEFSYLVIGKDAKAVDALYEGLRGRLGGVEVVVVGNKKSRSGFSLSAVAGGVIVGAAAAIAGLAYV